MSTTDEHNDHLEGLDPEVVQEGEAHELDLEAQLAELDARYRRALADYQNFQRRAIENEQRAREQGAGEIVRALIPVLDHCGLALTTNPESVTAQQVLDGVRGIVEQFTQTMARFGVATIEPEPGDAFDPGEHEAMLRTESDEVEPGAVVQLLQIGYRMDGRVVRPAQVSVRPSEGGG